ncbi:AI-2E family transporter [Bacillus sp. M6-12]|uniref:AI-2E family transporter n=1 Tax=Bacillus sp. M6-12 TaxID=2054166 RepID=UPI000C784A13|nr:AI-2E family transporter [Bacillus sp. M6-12]PLS19034.1 AI-2E family transporter [Bacillus sp. M6-12]
MNFFKELAKSEGAKKFLAIVVLILFLFSLKSMFNLLLLTFIFTFLFSSLQNLIYTKVSKVLPIKKSLVTILIYLSALGGLVLAIVKYIPILGKQLMAIGTQISNFKIEDYADKIDPRLFGIVKGIKVDEYVAKGTKAFMEYAPHIGEFSLNIMIAFLLSFFFILEKDKIAKFGESIEKSKIAWMYKYYKQFGMSFLNSFGKVLNVQILISFINAVLSIIMLAFLGFSQVIGLGFMIFILGLIPVAGVVISFIPISIIAFTIGGIMKVLLVVVMIVILHALESYILNPKLMSMKTELPIFFTFVILVVGEHTFGIWGLLVGLPMFMFFLDISDITPEHEEKPKKKKKEASQ